MLSRFTDFIKRLKLSFPTALLLSLLLILLVFAAFFTFRTLNLTKEIDKAKTGKSDMANENSELSSGNSSGSIIVSPHEMTENWKVYENKKYRISFKYPDIGDKGYLQVFEPENDSRTIFLNVDESGGLFFDLIVLLNTKLEDRYAFVRNEAKQKASPSELIDGPTISGIKSKRTLLKTGGPEDLLITFIQKGEDLYQINIPAKDNGLQRLIMYTIKFMD